MIEEVRINRVLSSWRETFYETTSSYRLNLVPRLASDSLRRGLGWQFMFPDRLREAPQTDV